LQADGAPVALNIGTGRGHSVLEVLAAAKRVTGRDIPVRHAPRRPGDPPVLTADVTTSKQTLGFAARWLDMDEIIRTAWAFQQKQACGSAAG
jgi:UDP-arabinose 4-epimerase